MTPEGHRGVACSTDDRARALEDLQFTLGAGPGPTAFDTGLTCFVPDLETDGVSGDWLAFRSAALDLGVRAIFAFPLRLGAASLGVLTLSSTDNAALDGSHLTRAMRLSNAAAAALLDLIVGVTTGTEVPASGSADTVAAEFYRSEIYQAAGMLMVQLGVSIDVAMVRLRSYAFANGQSTGDVARDIVSRKLNFDLDTELT